MKNIVSGRAAAAAVSQVRPTERSSECRQVCAAPSLSRLDIHNVVIFKHEGLYINNISGSTINRPDNGLQCFGFKVFGCESSPISRNVRALVSLSVSPLDKCKVKLIKAQ